MCPADALQWCKGATQEPHTNDESPCCGTRCHAKGMPVSCPSCRTCALSASSVQRRVLKRWGAQNASNLATNTMLTSSTAVTTPALHLSSLNLIHAARARLAAKHRSPAAPQPLSRTLSCRAIVYEDFGTLSRYLGLFLRAS